MATFRRGAAAVAAGLMVLGGASAATAQPVENTNDPAFWAELLMDPEGEFADLGLTEVECIKLDGAATFDEHGDYVEDDFDGDGVTEWGFAPAEPWLAVVLKAGSDESTEGADELALFVENDEILWHSSGKQISHIILCDGTVPDEEPEEPVEEPEEPVEEPEEPTTPGEGDDDAGEPIGPIVQTDVPAKGVDPAAPLAALAAAGLGLAAVGLRRRGQES